MVAHGAPWDDPGDYRCQYVYPHDKAALLRLSSIDADVVLLGHTHTAMSVRQSMLRTGLSVASSA